METKNLEAIIKRSCDGGHHIVTAESLTCGMISAALANVSGASAVLLGGPDVYQDEMKALELGVPPKMLAEFSAVSQQVAEAMVQGCFDKYDARALGDKAADIAVAVTGYAGSTGGLAPNSDAGLVYIGIGTHFDRAAEPSIDVHEHRFDGNRAQVRAATTDKALGYVLDILK